MSDETLAEALGGFAADAPYESLPAAVVESVKLRILDILGIALAAGGLDTSRAARHWASDQGGSARAPASAIGITEPLAPSVAAFVNGVLAHSLDFDDTHLPSVAHPSASIIPAVLAAAESSGGSGRDAIAAMAVGIESCVRLAMAGYDREQRNSLFFEHGQHATSICGTLGAALAVGMVRKLDRAGHVNALGVAASFAAGIIEANRGGGTVKRLHCGWAAHAGVSAAELVAHGFTGPRTVLEGRFGFYQAWLHGTFFPEEILGELGERWLIPAISFKPYPANHFTHAAIDAAIQLREGGLDPADIAAIRLFTGAPAMPTIGEPIELKRAPQTAYMAQFSGPYAVVAGLIGGGGLGVGLDDYTDELAVDPERRRLMAMVTVEADPACTALFPEQFPAILEVTTKSGETVRASVLENRGGPTRPLSADEVRRKFRDNASRAVSTTIAMRIEETVDRLESAPGVASLMSVLREVDVG